MIMKKRLLVILCSILLGLVLWFAPLPLDIPVDARRVLALSLVAIVWWLFKVIPNAYTSLLFVATLILTGAASPGAALALWSRPMIWLVISSFLLAAAVSKSGLARRLSLLLLSRYATTYPKMILIIYVLASLLSFLIPQAFPRALILMAVTRQVIAATQCSQRVKVSLGFAVFSSVTVTSMFILTGDAILNLTAVTFAIRDVSWLEWFVNMSVPALVASALMYGLHLLVFGTNHTLQVDQKQLASQYQALGRLNRDEAVTLFWVSSAIIIWMLDSITGIDPAWIAVAAAVGLSLPLVGDVLNAEDITQGISWPVLLFFTGAFAIGTVSSESGLSSWLAQTLLPTEPPQNPFLFAALIVGGTMGVHMLIGSALATLSVTAPSVVSYAVSAGWDPLFPALLVYTGVSIHYLLPFHNVVILIGEGETGGYSAAETLRFGLPMTVLTWVVVLAVEVPWWKLVGLI
jgi:anion transporter